MPTPPEKPALAEVGEESRWLEFLAEAGARVSASLDLGATLQAVARVPVPDLADWAAVHVKENGEIRRVAEHDAPNDDDIALALAATQALRIPLTFGEKALGTLTFGVRPPRGPLGSVDRARAKAYASRCSAAIENGRLYQKALASVAARDEFLSVATHELQTPLTALLLMLHVLERTGYGLPEAELKERFSALARQGAALSQLVSRLLDVSRAGAGRIQLVAGRMDLAALVRDVVGRFRPAAQAAGSTIVVDAPRSLMGVWDRGRLDQALGYLVDNAIRFGSAKGIEIRLTGDATEVALTVTDHGVGIASERLPYVFELFKQDALPRRHGGLGLGLYVARQLVSAHAGRIEVVSDPGQGSSFTIRLPRGTT